MAKVRHLKAVLDADDRASRKIGAVSGALSSLGKIATGVGVVALGRKLVQGISAVIVKFGEQERAEKTLEAAFRSLGMVSRRTADEAKAFAGELQRVTTVGDETIIGVEQLLVSLGRLSGTELKRATKATLDLSAAVGIDLKAAALLMAKAAQGETSSLSRYGLVLDKAIPQSEKFAAVLKKIEVNFGGMAMEMRKQTLGAMDAFKNALGDTMELYGEMIVRAATFGDTMENVTTKLERFNKAFAVGLRGPKIQRYFSWNRFFGKWLPSSTTLKPVSYMPLSQGLSGDFGIPTSVYSRGIAPYKSTTGGLGGFGVHMGDWSKYSRQMKDDFDAIQRNIQASGEKMRHNAEIAKLWRNTMYQIGAAVADQVSAGLAAAIVQGQKLHDVFKSILQTVIQIAIRAAIFSVFGFREGGIVGGRKALHARSGLFVGGHDTGRDTVPIIARPGEMILPREISQLLLNAAGGGGGGGMQVQFQADMPGLVTQIRDGVVTGRWRLAANEVVTTRAVR